MYLIAKYVSNKRVDTSCYCDISYSSYNSYSGELAGIKQSYTDLEEAIKDLDKIQTVNPGVTYSVVSVLEK